MDQRVDVAAINPNFMNQKAWIEREDLKCAWSHEGLAEVSETKHPRD